VRILITVNPAPGHLFALVPLAWALHLDGHQVLVAAPQSLSQQVRRASLSTAVVGGNASFLEHWPADRKLGGNPELDLTVFVAIAEQTAPDVIRLVRAWRPDLIVSEPVEYAGPLAATLTGTPWLRHLWGVPVAEHLRRAAEDAVAGRLERLHLAHDLWRPVDAPMATIDTCPPSLRVDSGHVEMRYVPYNGAGTMPEWLFEPPSRPRVCVSMGTVPIPEGVDGLAAAVAGLAELDVEVIVSGAGVHGVGELPANARRIAWIPHHHLLPSCDLFVHHGGSGSSMAGIVAGRPQLVLPQMCDQFAVADRLADAGVARVVPFAARSASAVRSAAESILGDVRYAVRAAELRDEALALPSPASVAAELADHLIDRGRAETRVAS
jgi:UDP:flavonoid glycosyltransferase YjiC (YdhE family)